MYFPKLTAPAQRRVTVDRFLGLDRRAGSAMGCFQNMENLWSGGYPALETRPARGETAVLSKPNGLTCRDALVWVDGTALYVGGEKTGLALSDGEKQLVNMGAYLLIWPDRKYINTQDLSDFGSMENRNVTAGEVTTALCRSGGEELGDYAAGAAAPDAPEAGTLWLDTSDAEPVMKRYDGSAWLDVENVCTKISAAGIGRGFAAGDGVTVEGCEAQTLNGLHVLDAAGDDWIAVPAATAKVRSQTAEVTAARRVPDMDFVVEQGNRLWGCKYGIVDGRPVNEIYASKLGDFRNWNSFAGLSTDSYAASRGSDGAFTGAAACLGGVIFFKEDCMERVYPSATGAHQIVTLRCPGVKKGCHGAAAVVDGTLFYLGLGGVYAFDGSMPGCVSMPLGSVRYQDGLAALADAFDRYRENAAACVRTGVVGYDGTAPVYGTAVGFGLACRDADGETEVEPNGFRAVFTGEELSLRQDAQEVARVADGRLHVNGMAALGGADVGGWRMEDNGDGLAIRWIGG